jgi:hypothetical protein
MKSSAVEQSSNIGSGEVDPTWKPFYKVGGITAILYILLSLVIPTIQVLAFKYDFYMGAEELLKYIAENKAGWLFLQTAVLGTSILALISFIALYLALKHIDKNMAMLGAIILVTCELLFMAYYPVLLGLIYLSEQYIKAAVEQQVVFTTAAESLLAMNNGFNPLYESLFGFGIFFFSLAMLKGVFHKWVAYVGIVTPVAAIAALSLWPVLGVNYFWWWIFFMVWFSAVGFKLYQLGK